MSEFVLGDEVADGTGRKGTITDSFFWGDADDGVTNERPPHGSLPVEWSDGTRGYRLPSTLEFSYV